LRGERREEGRRGSEEGGRDVELVVEGKERWRGLESLR